MILGFDVKQIKLLLNDVFVRELASATNTTPHIRKTNGTTAKLKRRWNDDVVFRNQAKGEPDRNKKRFINDTVRNDFHKRFLNKFIL